jgi:hypothetical protein
MSAYSSTFRTGEASLPDILRNVNSGKIQLPDFQRGWVWDDDHIRSLVASISLAYPIGAVMLLETSGDGAHFMPRPVEGVVLNNGQKPERLILDGQQRMTSLYLALFSGKPVPTKTEKGQRIDRLYYLDIAKCLNLDEDRFDAVVSVPPERKVTSDFGRKVELDVSTPDNEFELGLFPVSCVFDPAVWRRGYQKKYRQDEPKLDIFDEFEKQIVERFQQYRVPTIELLRETPKEAVCQVFEKVNTGGVTLTVFELITATFAADNFNLRMDWETREYVIHEQKVLQSIDATALLTAVTLLSSYRRNQQGGSPVSCKRKDVLKLRLDEYQCLADQVQAGLIRAAKMLTREKVFDSRSLPYTTQLIPLSAMCAVLGDRFEEEPVKQKLARWFWCGVFGELYGGANESRFAYDLPEVIAWINGGDEPRTVKDASISPTRLLSLQTRNSAAYKGLMVLLTEGESSRDFLSGDPIDLNFYFDEAIDIHHIFPRSFCEKQKLSTYLTNCSVNKAPLTARTNRIIGGNAPSSYLASLEKNHAVSNKKLDTILKSHKIAPNLLRSDDFTGFLRDRATRLLDLIEEAMGKKVSGRDSEEVVAAFGGPLLGLEAPQ